MKVGSWEWLRDDVAPRRQVRSFGNGAIRIAVKVVLIDFNLRAYGTCLEAYTISLEFHSTRFSHFDLDRLAWLVADAGWRLRLVLDAMRTSLRMSMVPSFALAK